MQEASQRLGAGATGGDLDYFALKSHPFFDGINWENLDQIKPLLKPPLRSFPHPNDCIDSDSEEFYLTTKDAEPLALNVLDKDTMLSLPSPDSTAVQGA